MKNCINCGKSNPDTSNFCGYCGNKFGDKSPEETRIDKSQKYGNSIHENIDIGEGDFLNIDNLKDLRKMISFMSYGALGAACIQSPEKRCAHSVLLIKETTNTIQLYNQTSGIQGEGIAYHWVDEGVLIVSIMIIMGDNLYDIFYNAYNEDTILLFENISRSKFVYVLFFDGISEELGYITKVNNFAPTFRSVLSQLSNIPKWTEAAFKKTLNIFLHEYPTPEKRYAYLKNRMGIDKTQEKESKVIHLVITKDIIEKQDIKSTLLVLASYSKDLLAYRNSVQLSISGYRNDSREIYEIPEIRKYFQKLFYEEPGLLYWIDIDAWWMLLGFLLYQPIYLEGGITLSFEDIKSYIERSGEGLINFCDNHHVSPEPTMDKIIKVFNSLMDGGAKHRESDRTLLNVITSSRNQRTSKDNERSLALYIFNSDEISHEVSPFYGKYLQQNLFNELCQTLKQDKEETKKFISFSSDAYQGDLFGPAIVVLSSWIKSGKHGFDITNLESSLAHKITKGQGVEYVPYVLGMGPILNFYALRLHQRLIDNNMVGYLGFAALNADSDFGDDMKRLSLIFSRFPWQAY